MTTTDTAAPVAERPADLPQAAPDDGRVELGGGYYAVPWPLGSNWALCAPNEPGERDRPIGFVHPDDLRDMAAALSRPEPGGAVTVETALTTLDRVGALVSSGPHAGGPYGLNWWKDEVKTLRSAWAAVSADLQAARVKEFDHQAAPQPAPWDGVDRHIAASALRDLAAGLQDGSIKGAIGHDSSTYAAMGAEDLAEAVPATTATLAEVELQVRARQIAADKMGLIKDPTGSRLPDDLWRRALPQAEAESLDELRALAADDNIRTLQGIAQLLKLPDFTDVTADAVASALRRGDGDEVPAELVALIDAAEAGYDALQSIRDDIFSGQPVSGRNQTRGQKAMEQIDRVLRPDAWDRSKDLRARIASDRAGAEGGEGA